MAIIATVPTRVIRPVTAPTSETVVTARSSVVPAVTRDIRSSGSARSTADMRSRSSRATAPHRTVSTTASPVRVNR